MTTFFEKIKKYRKGEEAANKIKRYRAGFTLAEVLIVVAIMAILAGFGFVAVSQYNKRLTQLEMDDTAKKIFLAAQNHLTIADTSGIWKQLVAECNSTSKSGNPNGPSLGGGFSIVGDTTSYHVIYGKGNAGQSAGTDVGNQKNVSDVLNLILPANSVNIGTDGQYAIVYNAQTATIYGVYYSASSTFGNDQDSLQFAKKIPDIDRFDAKKRLEQEVKDKAPLIGYYGNATGTTKESKTSLKALEKVKVWFTNEEDALTLHILDPNSISLDASDATNLNNLEVRITGDRSGTTAIYSVKKLETDESYMLFSSGDDRKLTLERPDSDKGKADYTIVFDGLTGKHFKDLLPDFYPGEDITAQVTLTRSEKITGREIVTGSATDNSLYESIYPSVSGNADSTVDQGQYVARIENVRHLENLSKDISGISTYTASGTLDKPKKAFSVRKAVLLENIDLAKARDGFTFSGILPDTALEEFDGNNKSIKGMNINADPSGSNGNGLFAMIERSDAQPGFAIKDLTMERPNVKSSGANVSVGTLIGYFKGNSLFINRVYVNVDTNGQLIDTIGQQSNEIIGQADAGGLVGLIENASSCEAEIRNCLVERLQVLSNNGNAGGFIGELTDSDGAVNNANLTISQSKFIEPVSVDPNGDSVDNYDIYAKNGSAGGFIGTSGTKPAGKDSIKHTNWVVNIADCEITSDHRFNIVSVKQTGGIVGGFYSKQLSVSKTLVAGKYLWIKNTTTGGSTDGNCAGGFIGEGFISTSVTIENCGAGAYVYAPEADCAGGLIGSLKGGTGSSIKNTYVSGHTNASNYLDSPYTGTIETLGGYNVYGCTAIGGLIGYTSATGLSVENCTSAASVSANIAYADKDIKHGIIGGFIGQTQNELIINFNYCITVGKVFKNGKYFDQYGGSFIGEIRRSFAGNSYSFTDTYVLTGNDYNDFQTLGKINASNIEGQIKSYSAPELQNKANTDHAVAAKTTPFDETLIGQNYPYPLKTLLQRFGSNDYTHDELWYLGDWVVPQVTKTFDGDFGILYYEQVQDGDEANATTHYYYHGYVGYETGSVDNKPGNQYTEIYTRMTDPAAPGILDRNDKALPIEHNRFVVEQGYLILVRNTFNPANLMVDMFYHGPSNNNKTTLEDLIKQKAVIEEADHYYSKAMKFDGFNCYYVKVSDNDRDGALDPHDENNKTQLRFTQISNGQPHWDTSATFAFNPMFSDISLMNSERVPREECVYKVRSAETLYNLFATGYAMNTGWNSRLHMMINLDISFHNTLKFQQFDVDTCKPKDVTWDSDKVTLSQLHFEMYSDYYSKDQQKTYVSDSSANTNELPDDEKANLYSIDYLTAPLIGSNNGGNLHDIYVKNYIPSQNTIQNHKTESNETSAALFGSSAFTGETYSNILVDHSEGPILYDAGGTIEHITVKDIKLSEDFGYQGIFSHYIFGAHLYDIKIDHISVGSNAKCGAVFGYVQSDMNKVVIKDMSVSGSIKQNEMKNEKKAIGILIDETSSGCNEIKNFVLEHMTIGNTVRIGINAAGDEVDTMPAGLIGRMGSGSGAIHDVAFRNISVDASVTNDNFTIQSARLYGSYFGIIGEMADKTHLYNLTLDHIDFLNVNAEDAAKLAIIGDNKGAINFETDKTTETTITNYSTAGYGFVVTNEYNGHIQNVTIKGADIRKTGFAKDNGGFIEKSFITNNGSTISSISENGFVESNSQSIKNCHVEHAIVGLNGFVGTNTGLINCDCTVEDTDVLSGSGFAGINGQSGSIGVFAWNDARTAENWCKLINVEVKGNNTEVAGFVTENNGTIQNIDLKNVVTDNIGFVWKNNAYISYCNIINGWFNMAGFVRDNNEKGNINHCQIYGDKDVYSSDNSRLYKKLRINAENLTSPIYQLVTIGIKKATKNSDNSYTYSYNSEGIGFVRNNYGAISYCSATAEVYADNNASGFVHQQNKNTISYCYANTIVHSNGDGFGFACEMYGNGTSIQQSHSVGEIHAKEIYNNKTISDSEVGSCGFIGKLDNGPSINNCYSAVWMIEANKYYCFARNLGSVNNCGYLKLGNNKDTANYGITGYDNSDGLKNSNYYYSWQPGATVQYKQYFINQTTGGSDSNYPYSLQNGLTFYGDWWENGSQAVSASAGAKANPFNIQSISANLSSSNVMKADAGYQLRRKTHTLACGMKAACICDNCSINHISTWF